MSGVFARAGDNRLRNYKITKFTVFMRSRVESGGVGGSGVIKLSLERSERKRGRGLPKLNKYKQVGRGS